MTKEEIIEMAKKVGVGMLHDGEFALMGNEKIKAFAKLIAQKEREECAKLCDESEYPDGIDLAYLIRARGQE